MNSEIKLSDYKYDLPDHRIARYPLEDRSDSKLLVFNNQITHSKFKSIEDFLPIGSMLVFNNTKVIPARLYLKKETGSEIELFLTEPISPFRDIAKLYASQSPAIWKCIIGNKKKWKEGQTIYAEVGHQRIQAEWHDRENDIVEISWDRGIPFQEVIEQLGNMPLPPYMKRAAEEGDKERYQTVYSKTEGAVAAPTAGLHFTGELLRKLSNSHDLVEVTLHVSAGTFKPVSSENIKEHEMHREFVNITRHAIEQFATSKKLVLTGTTTMRTLESLYWFGVKILNGDTEFHISKLYPYEHGLTNLPSREEALEAILNFMTDQKLDELTGSTEIFIFPGYKFKMTDALITNFHLPGSTLVLLVAALVGPNWRVI